MAFSNLVAFFIMLTTAVTLHAHGITDIQTSEQAAQALRPLAGDFAYLLFTAGIVGTGLLAVPVLAGSAAYAVAESFRWPIGLGLPLLEARGFYAILTAATVIAVGIDFADVDPIKALLWSAVVNGVIAVPIMVVMMRLVTMPEVMGPFVASWRLRALGLARHRRHGRRRRRHVRHPLNRDRSGQVSGTGPQNRPQCPTSRWYAAARGRAGGTGTPAATASNLHGDEGDHAQVDLPRRHLRRRDAAAGRRAPSRKAA